jgi:hypothetical protein
MSTSFDVYPKTLRVPSFQEVLDVASLRLREFRRDFAIPGSPTITVELRSKEPDITHPFDLAAPATWAEGGRRDRDRVAQGA